jgi:hypothetical protein
VPDGDAVPRPTTNAIARPKRKSFPMDLITTRGTAPLDPRGSDVENYQLAIGPPGQVASSDLPLHTTALASSFSV